MSVDTHGKIKGYIKHEDICDYIKQTWDKNALDHVKKQSSIPLSQCNWEHKINEHSEDNENWYSIYGFITFKCNDNIRNLFYHYSNVNHYENLKYYSEFGLENMVKSETTYISLSCYGGSISIIKNILEHFGGGWIDENDCDDKEYYEVNPNK